MTNKDFDFNNVPRGYALCFSTDCPLRSTCMRHLAGENVPADMTIGTAVFPHARHDDACEHYREVRLIRCARGFSDILADMRRSDYTAMRHRLVDYLGHGGSFYRFRSGERLLTPEQQEWMRQLMRDFGYDDNIQFNGYVTTYDFS